MPLYHIDDADTENTAVHIEAETPEEAALGYFGMTTSYDLDPEPDPTTEHVNMDIRKEDGIYDLFCVEIYAEWNPDFPGRVLHKARLITD